MSSPKEFMNFDSARFSEALQYANNLHFEQRRKGSTIPYVSHLMHVSAYVLEFGGDTDQAIAGLLHDIIEDQGSKTSYAEIEQRFGKKVSELVRACTDSETEVKESWEKRKLAYIQRLEAKDSYTKLVVACDKYHNLQAIVRDVNSHGIEYLSRFSAKPDRLLWYYENLLKGLQNLDNPVVKLFQVEVEAFQEIIWGNK